MTLSIDIWSDVICPFCYIGKAHLAEALRRANLEAQPSHRAFRLMPGQAPEPVVPSLARRYGQPPAAIEASQRQVEAAARQAGLAMHLSGTLTGDTALAHRLILGAGERESDLVERLCRAYFGEGRNIFDRSVLLAIAEEAGLEAAAAEAMLSSPALFARIESDEAEAARLGVGGVPFFVLSGRLAISGAQPVEAFQAAIERARSASTGNPGPQRGFRARYGPDSAKIRAVRLALRCGKPI